MTVKENFIQISRLTYLKALMNIILDFLEEVFIKVQLPYFLNLVSEITQEVCVILVQMLFLSQHHNMTQMPYSTAC